MTISLYDVSVANYLQGLDAVSGFLDKTAAHCRETNVDLEEMVESRIFTDMRPLRFQIQQVALHSLGAIHAVKSGAFEFPGQRPALDYAGLQTLIVDTRAALRKITPDEVNARLGAEVSFEAGDVKRVFTAEGFVLSFSLPNFYFHATTAYDILRMKGVPLGKRDYTGALRLKG
ncbi:MAG TPA: DUF1993 domain-containing protein [Methylovirgula sp.]